eukprot:3678327-Amphidinium_carterae.1
MARYSLDIRMTPQMHSKDGSSYCNVTSSQLHADTLVMLDRAYADDFKLLGYRTGREAARELT